MKNKVFLTDVNMDIFLINTNTNKNIVEENKKPQKKKKPTIQKPKKIINVTDTKPIIKLTKDNIYCDI